MLNVMAWRQFAIPLKNTVRFNFFYEIVKTTINVSRFRRKIPRTLKMVTFSTLSGVALLTTKGKNLKEILKEADDLFDQNKCDKIVQLLEQHKDMKDADVLWRLCRAKYTMAKDISDGEKRKKVISEANDLIKEAVTLNEASSPVHKWMAILMSSMSEYYGIKEKIMQAYDIKKHMLRALELNPKDATVHHLLGCWCYEVATLPWYQRKIASTIFAAPPNSSFDEALQHFLKAEEVDPQFYSMNFVMLGKTYLRLNDKEKAIFYLNLATEYPQKTSDDAKAKEEATSLLKKM